MESLVNFLKITRQEMTDIPNEDLKQKLYDSCV